MTELQPGRRLSVLTVEDEPLISMMIEAVLQDAGYAVRSAGTSIDALSLIDANAFDVAVVDIGLTAGHSFAVAEALLAKQVPFLFCTASDDPIVAPFLNIPVVAKPFSETDLLAALTSVMDVPAQPEVHV